MKRSGLLIAFVSLLILSVANAQTSYDLKLKNGSLSPEANVPEFVENFSFSASNSFNGYHYTILQFTELPGPALREQLAASGIELMTYLPDQAYLSRIGTNAELPVLLSSGVRSVIALESWMKLDPALLSGNYPEWTVAADGSLDLSVYLHNASEWELAALFLRSAGYQLIKARAPMGSIALNIPAQELHLLALLPFVSYVAPVAPPDVPEDREGRSLHRSNAINSDAPMGRHYDGSGVGVVIADDGAVGPHIDFKGRLTQYTTDFSPGATHGDMTGGICVGAGNLDPTIRGHATGAHLYFYDIGGYPQISNAVSNLTNLGILLSSTSYSQGSGGEYTADASAIDQQISQNPTLIHIFSAGNAGGSDHGYGAGPGWGNITGGYKAAKNVIASGDLNDRDALENTSSRGPAGDGRIKPDLCANGYQQLSTAPGNGYQVGGGTSAASPSIAGTFTQLHHAYRELNGGNTAESALIRASLQNTAEDLGNPGPDFLHGWGRINALRAVKTLEENRYLSATVSNGVTNTHVINVPNKLKQLRLMVHWTDVEGSSLAAKALVNDLNLRLSDGMGTNWLPWVLDPTPNPVNLSASAVPGIDDLNTSEQITINNPLAGAYTVEVEGFAVPFGPQKYYLVWEFVTDEITLTYPMGNEGFVPGESEVIRWDAFGNTNSFSVEYSADSGLTWQTAAASLPANRRYYEWTVPSLFTGQALVRVNRDTISGTSPHTFSIADLATNLTFPTNCTDSVIISWDPVPGATAYEVQRLGAMYMDSIGTTSTTTFTYLSNDPYAEDWFSVRTLGPNGLRSRRTQAVQKTIGPNNCSEPPYTNFSVSTQVSCPYLPVSFQDLTFNNPTGWQWIIDPVNVIYVNSTSANSANPYVLFTAPGTYDITLITTNPFGNDTLFFPAYVTITTGLTPPLTEDFEAAPGIPAGWKVENPDAGISWEPIAGITGSDGNTTQSIYVNNYDYFNSGERDYFISPPLDFSGTSSVALSFDIAYARFSQNFSDTLRIDISTDCGISWMPSGFYKGGSDLATVGDQFSSWQPASASDWRSESLNLTSLAGSGQIAFRFVCITGYGNGMFIDNINLSPPAAAAFTYSGDTCVAQTLTFTNASSGAIQNYVWNFGFGANPISAFTAGPHQVTYSTPGQKFVQLIVSDGMSTNDIIQQINIAPQSLADFTANVNGLSVSFTNNSTGTISWMWDFGDGNTSTLQEPVHTYATGGTYTVELIANGNCGPDTTSISLSAWTTGISDLLPAGAFQVYPNPTSGMLRISADPGLHDATIYVYDMNGRLLLEGKTMSNGFLDLDLSHESAGMYLIRLQTEEGVASRKVLKE
jgi:PKD repeat protein